MKKLHHTAVDMKKVNLPVIDNAGAKKERGGSVISMLAWLAIVGVIGASIWGMYRYVNKAATVRVELTNLTSIVSGARQLKSAGSYANVDNAALQRIQAFGNMTGSGVGGTVRHAWNGTVEVTGSASALTIKYNGVPESVCDQFVIGAMGTGDFSEPGPTCNESGNTDLTFTAY